MYFLSRHGQLGPSHPTPVGSGRATIWESFVAATRANDTFATSEGGLGPSSTRLRLGVDDLVHRCVCSKSITLKTACSFASSGSLLWNEMMADRNGQLGEIGTLVRIALILMQTSETSECLYSTICQAMEGVIPGNGNRGLLIPVYGPGLWKNQSDGVIFNRHLRLLTNRLLGYVR